MSGPKPLQTGEIVRVMGSEPLDGFKTSGLRGKVIATCKDLICVDIPVSPIYQPCFWYREAQLARSGPEPIYHLGWFGIETSFYQRPYCSESDVVNRPIHRGLLRSWLWLKTEPEVDSDLGKAIMSEGIVTLAEIYRDTTDNKLRKYISAYDFSIQRSSMFLEE
jgi:hypothetical protein